MLLHCYTLSATCGMRCPWRTMNLTKLHGQSGIGRFSTRLNRSRWAATNCLSNAAAIGTQQRSWIHRVRSHNSAPSHLLGHGAADAAQSSCSSGHLFRQLRGVQASHRKHPGTDRCDAMLSGIFSKKKAEKIQV